MTSSAPSRETAGSTLLERAPYPNFKVVVLNDEVNTIQKELEQQGENPDADGIKQMIKERLESQMVFEWLEKHCEVEYV